MIHDTDTTINEADLAELSTSSKNKSLPNTNNQENHSLDWKINQWILDIVKRNKLLILIILILITKLVPNFIYLIIINF